MAQGSYPLADSFLSSIWSSLGGAARDIEDVTFSGDEAYRSCFAMTDLGAASFAAAGSAIAELMTTAAAPLPHVHVDRVLSTAWFRGPSRHVGPLPEPARRSAFRDMSTDYPTADGRYIRFQANYEHLRDAILAVLGTKEDPEEIARVIAKHGADEIEQAIIDGGGAAAASRTVEEWALHPQGAATNAEPLVDVFDRSSGNDTWRPTPGRPLAGIRVLDITRVLAGPMGTRCLAGFGAEVLRLDPPGYFEPGGGSGGDTVAGKRCAFLDLKTTEGRDRFLELLSSADVFVHGLRPGALEGLGLGPDVIAETRPGLVELELDAYGYDGPWKERRGFDTLVQQSTGMADAGMRWAKTDRPFRWAFSILDHATGYMIAAAAIRGLTKRVRNDKGSLSRLALARTAALIIAPGQPPEETEIELPMQGPFEERVAVTTSGPVQRLAWPIEVEGQPFYWERPGDPYGTSTPTWAGPSARGSGK